MSPLNIAFNYSMCSKTVVSNMESRIIIFHSYYYRLLKFKSSNNPKFSGGIKTEVAMKTLTHVL